MNTIFSHLLYKNDGQDTVRSGYVEWFLDTFPCSEFTQDDRLFWHFLRYCSDLSVSAKFSYLQAWIDTELRELLHEVGVRVPGCEQYSFDDPLSFETAVRVTKEVLEDDYKVLESYPIEVSDFKVEMSAYMSSQCKEKMASALANTFEMLNKTDNAIEANIYCMNQMSLIQTIYNKDNLKDLDSYTSGSETEDSRSLHRVGSFGIPAIDKDSGGIYTTRLYDVSAQPGKGKTRFTIGQIVYNTITVDHNNVLMLLLEQTVAEAKAMMLALHVFKMFNIQITDAMIYNNEVPEEYQKNVEAAKYDLFKSGKYGKVEFIEDELYVETFINRINVLDSLKGPFDIIIIDYIGLIESKPAKYAPTLREWEILKVAYRVFKRWVRRHDKAGISVTQFGKEGTQAGRSDKEITADMLQGGMAAARNMDYGVHISSTESMDVQQQVRFGCTKSRYSRGFDSFLCDVRLGFCWFRQIATKQV